MNTAFKRLIVKYARGRTICNCGQAYSSANGACRYGCSTNQIYAKEYIAEQTEKEIDVLERLQKPKAW